MKTVSDYIEFVRLLIARPALFDVNKVEDIYFLLRGFTYKSNNEELMNFCNSFNSFINKQEFVCLKPDAEKEFAWHKITRLYSSSDVNSLELFSRLFERFLASYYG